MSLYQVFLTAELEVDAINVVEAKKMVEKNVRVVGNVIGGRSSKNARDVLSYRIQIKSQQVSNPMKKTHKKALIALMSHPLDSSLRLYFESSDQSYWIGKKTPTGIIDFVQGSFKEKEDAIEVLYSLLDQKD